MPISVTCPCGRLLKVKDEYAGRIGRCPTCKQSVQIPAAEPEEDALDELPVVEAAEPPRRRDPRQTERERYSEEDEDRPRRRSQRDNDEEDDDRPRRRSARDSEDDDPPRRRSLRDEDDDEDDRRSVSSERSGRKRPSLRKEKPRKVRSESGGRSGVNGASILGGIGMMVLAVVWFVVGLYFDRIFFYPPVLLVIGIIAVVKGLMGSE